MVKRERRKKKIPKLWEGLLEIAMVASSGAFLIYGSNDLMTYFNLKGEIQANSDLLEETRARQEELENTKKNLTNPDYLEFVARGRYHVSKQGEQVFVFPALSQDENAKPLNTPDLPEPYQDSAAASPQNSETLTPAPSQNEPSQSPEGLEGQPVPAASPDAGESLAPADPAPLAEPSADPAASAGAEGAPLQEASLQPAP